MIAYVVLGTTDDVTTCERCGKPELFGTVVLGELDADGNVEGVAYFGSTCAARALGRSGRGAGARVRIEADAAAQAVRADAESARQFFAHYGYDTPIEDVAVLYRQAHARAMWAASESWSGWVLRAAKAVVRHTAALDAAARLDV